MKMHAHGICRMLALGALLATSTLARAEQGDEFFEKHVRPTLVDKCYRCHSAQAPKLKAGLRLDSREALLKGGDTGPAIVAGDPDKSLLIKAVRYGDPDLQMPPKEKLPEAAIHDVEQWIRMGAPWPAEKAATAAPTSVPHVEERKWAWGPLHRPTVPEVKNAAWVASPIDRFILAQLDQKGLHPAPQADRRTLIRRVTYDLTGLPPTDAEVNAFMADTSPNAWEKVVDRLLASPQYGERWGRHWLDAVRYTDSFDARVLGNVLDCSEAWRYRDWVVQAFNNDMPYDRFVQEQVAGDLLGNVVATGVYAIGNWGGGDADKEKLLTDIVDDQIDLTGRVFLGVTLACARCHDHKFDPITQEDYYGLAGIFFSSHILPNVGPKTNGPDMLRIPLLSASEMQERTRAESLAKDLDKKLQAGAGGLLAGRLLKVSGRDEVSGWGSSATPVVLANRGDAAIDIGTLTLPGHAVSMHPSPNGAVGAVWKSPLTGKIEITGAVKDADNKCGNGIDWALKAKGTVLAKGAIDNGGQQSFTATIDVAAGDELELAIGPRGDYSCDTTLVDWTIREIGGTQRHWNLAADISPNLLEGNPHPDALGNSGVWSFYDLRRPRVGTLAPAEIARLQSELSTLQAKLAAPVPMAHGLQEGGVPGSPQAGLHDVKVHIRGRYDRLGKPVSRRFPQVLAGDAQATIASGSGRLELARWLASPSNPMTARVMVNRIWQHHFGQGIVRTPNNFGKLGTPPTHPQLLDYLAAEFIANGWSVKAMHRQMLLSAAYRQSSESDPTSMKADPDNLLIGRVNRQRLDAEEIRDALLAAAGKMDLAMGGPAVKELSSPRRTIYLLTVRSDRSTYRSLFDAADPTAIVDQRIDSTVAPQALFLMNHPFILEQAQALSVLAQREKDPIDWLYRRLYARPATPRERDIALSLARQDGWEACCQVLLCANEFVYID